MRLRWFSAGDVRSRPLAAVEGRYLCTLEAPNLASDGGLAEVEIAKSVAGLRNGLDPNERGSVMLGKVGQCGPLPLQETAHGSAGASSTTCSRPCNKTWANPIGRLAVVRLRLICGTNVTTV